MSQRDEKAALSSEQLKAIVRKRKKKKIILVIIIAAAVLIVAAAIGVIIWQILRVKPIARTDEQEKVVCHVGKYDVYYDELSYLVQIHRSDYIYRQSNSTDGGLADMQTYVTGEVYEDIKKNYAVLALCEKYGIETDSRSLKSEVNDKIKDIIDGDFDGDKKKYKKWLEENGLSDAYYRLVTKVNLLEEKLLDALVQNKSEIKYSLENYKDFISYAKESDDIMRTTHIYYPKYYKYKNVNVSETRRQVEAIAASFKSIESDSERYDAFNDYIGRCPYMVEGYTMETLDGVYFTYGMMGEEYEDISRSLSEYDTSDVIETDDGFYIIMRLPKDSAYIEKNGDLLLSSYQQARLLVLEADMADSMEITGADIAALVGSVLEK